MAFDQIREHEEHKKWVDLMNAYIKATTPKTPPKKPGRRGRRR